MRGFAERAARNHRADLTKHSATLSLVRKWWVGLLGALLPAALVAASPFKTITPELRASLTSDYTIDVVVTPHEGDAWSRLAKRVTGDGDRWNEIAAFNHAGGNLTTEQHVRIPFNLLRPNLQRDVAAALFPSDSDTAARTGATSSSAAAASKASRSGTSPSGSPAAARTTPRSAPRIRRRDSRPAKVT